MSCFVQKYLTINSLKFLVYFSKYCSCFVKTTANTAVPNQQQLRPLLVFWQNSLPGKHEIQLGWKLQIPTLKI